MTTELPTTEGLAPFLHPSPPQPCHTYYKVIGDLDDNTRQRTPLILIHGGPGTGHEYLLPFTYLYSTYGIPLIFYDQLGCAASTHLRSTAGNTAFWNMGLFHAELDNLIDHLNLRSGTGKFDILGHSWGGRIAPSYAATRPKGLRRLVIASGLASSELAMEGTRLLRREKLPADVARVLNDAEEREEYGGEEYKKAMEVYMRTFFVRVGEWPPKELAEAFRHRGEDSTVPDAVLGPMPTKITGSMKGWSCIADLPKIEASTLVYNGEFDTSHDVATKPFFQKIPRVRWMTFAGAGHMAHIEGGGMREKVMDVVGEFLVDED